MRPVEPKLAAAGPALSSARGAAAPDLPVDAWPAQRIVVFVNRGAQRVRLQGHRAIERALHAALGRDLVAVYAEKRGRMHARLEALAREKPTAVVVVGGDGTARTALEILTPAGVPVAPLPGGTLNRLPRLVFGHASLTRSIEDLREAGPRALPGGRIGEHRFFVAAGFGGLMRMHAVREAARDDIGAAANILGRVWGRLFGPPLHWHRGDEAWRKANALLVGVGPLDQALGLRAPVGVAQGLEAAAGRFGGWFDVARVMGAAVWGNWRRHHLIDHELTPTLEIQGPANVIQGLLDGERVRLPAQFRVQFDPACGMAWGPRQRATP